MSNYLKNYKKLNILVTGSTGFKGSWLCFWLESLGAKVTGIGLKPEKKFLLHNELNLSKRIKQYICDIRNFKKLNTVVRKIKPDLIFHLAAQSIVSDSYKYPLETFSTNIIGSANVLETFNRNKIPALVYITSDKCYLNLDQNTAYQENSRLGGVDNYSSSKASAELIFSSYLNSFKKNFKYHDMASARAGNVIGGGDTKYFRLIPDLVKSIQKRENIIIRNPDSTRPWQHVLEPLSGYLLLGDNLLNKRLKPKILPSWNFAPERKNCKKVSVLVNSFLKEWGIEKKLIIKKNKAIHESSLLSLNIKKAKKELNWKPKLSFKETVKLTVEWYKKQIKKGSFKMDKFTRSQIEFYEGKR